jgi:hypothetical protein|tara:strand:- start:2310 stop:2624 length:315 start_codon:yes stop_codon:yes gene_type:complete
MMNNDTKENLKQTTTWIRGLYMLLFGFLAGLADFVLLGVIIFQFVHKLITGETNERLHKLGQSIATYNYQILQFLTFNSEYHPYPLGAWPKGEPKSVKEVTKDN